MAKMDLSKLNDFRVFQLTLNAVTKISIQATGPGKQLIRCKRIRK